MHEYMVSLRIALTSAHHRGTCAGGGAGAHVRPDPQLLLRPPHQQVLRAQEPLTDARGAQVPPEPARQASLPCGVPATT